MPTPPRRALSAPAAACGQSLAFFLLCAHRVAQRVEQLEQPRVEVETEQDLGEAARRDLLQSRDAAAPAPAADLHLRDAIAPAQRRLRTRVREVMIQLVRENCTLAVSHLEDAQQRMGE